MILISPSEPIELRQALGAVNNALCEGLGADILAPTPKGLLGYPTQGNAVRFSGLTGGRKIVPGATVISQRR